MRHPLPALAVPAAALFAGCAQPAAPCPAPAAPDPFTPPASRLYAATDPSQPWDTLLLQAPGCVPEQERLPRAAGQPTGASA